MRRIKYLYWNICKKNSPNIISDMIYENNIDILALVEAEKLDSNYLISELHRKNIDFKLQEIDPKDPGIKLFTRKKIKISVYKEEQHYSVYKVYNDGKDDIYLLFVVHFTSAMYKDEDARNFRAMNFSALFRKTEEEIYKEKNLYKSIIVGDFNLHPFSSGIIGVNGFNAVFSKYRATKISRTIQGEERLFYYNPMWQLIGRDRESQGTYYSNEDQSDRSFYWYLFDQILIRPSLIEQFNIDQLEIIEAVSGNNLLFNHKINKNFSDHLPVKFEIR